MKKSLVLFLLFVAFSYYAQQTRIDSLNAAFKNAKHDTTRVKLYVELSKELGGANSDTIRPLCEQGLALLSKISEGDKKSLTVRRAEGTLWNNIGYSYHIAGDILNAIEYYHKSQLIQEAIGDKGGTAVSLINIGAMYTSVGDLKKAEECFLKSLKLREDIRDKVGIGESLNNLGGLFYMQGNLKTALNYFQRSLQFREQTGNAEGIANSLNNIGSIYEKMGYYDKALQCCQRSLALIESTGNKWGISHALNSMGTIMFRLKKFKEAEDYSLRAFKMASEIGFPTRMQGAAETLYKIYKAQDQPKKALEMFEVSVKMKDSLSNKESEKAVVKKQMALEFEKKEAIEKTKVEAKQEIQRAEIARQKMQRNGFIGGFALMIALAGVSYRGYIQKRKAHTQIEKQKELVEEKHKEITDSINYAERIQRSFLATKEMLDANLQDYFVFFMPKDIVSGDFYWTSPLPGNKLAVAVGDSTGHGVPGAIMSLLNITSLEKAIESSTDPAKILNHTRVTIIERLKKDGSAGGGKDGMDCSLLIFDRANKMLRLASANNAVWIIRNNELLEIKADKMPVGKSDKEHESFSLHTVNLQEGDRVYALTDGFADQFGGPQGKKFKTKQIKDLLLVNSALPMTKQKSLLADAFKQWKGNLEQVDDVCVMGIKV